MLELNFTPFPNLTTERLLLRQLETGDNQEIFFLRSNDEVNKYLDRPKAVNIDDALNFIDKINASVANNEAIFWAIALKDESKLIGTIMFWNISRNDFRAEVGYELLPDYQGKGIMQEAFSKVIDYGFHEMKLHKIEAYTDVENKGSITLLEKNNFMKDEEFEAKKAGNEETKNIVVYSLLNK